jgi:hypothetical protein
MHVQRKHVTIQKEEPVMSNVLKYKTATGEAQQYILSVNTPDYQAPSGESSFLIDPELDNVQGVPVKYWKVSGGLVVEMSQAEKNAVDEALDLSRPPVSYPSYEYDPLNTLQCNTADWPVNHSVPVINDPNNEAIRVFQFDNGIASGIVFSLIFPAGVTCAVISLMYRAGTSPSTADKTLAFQARFRVIPDGAAINSWGQRTLEDIIVPQDVLYHKSQWIKNVSANNLGGKLLQVEIIRRGDLDSLAYPVYVNKIYFRFS